MKNKELQSQAQEMGRMVRFHRKRSGLTQQEAAKLAGIGKAALFDIEHGKTTVQLDTLMKLFAVLNIKLQFNSPLMQKYKTENK
jgi:HTH-type transcriptional regulator / antitoxin HipB